MQNELNQGKQMFRVEKFIPAECPKCCRSFQKEGRDYTRLPGNFIDGSRIVRKTKSYDNVVCTGCGNITAHVLIEAYQVSDRRKAVDLLKEGFVNPREMEVFGNHTSDTHEVFSPSTGLCVRSL